MSCHQNIIYKLNILFFSNHQGGILSFFQIQSFVFKKLIHCTTDIEFYWKNVDAKAFEFLQCKKALKIMGLWWLLKPIWMIRKISNFGKTFI